MALLHFKASLWNPALSPHHKLFSSFEPIKRPSSIPALNPQSRTRNITAGKSIPARDVPIDFGKHKGKLLGTLPSSYLKWVSRNLRARDFEHWARLADQVLDDPVYRDRIEWEFAENVLHGNTAKVTSDPSSRDEGAVSKLVEISERFGWNIENKAGWGMVNFELLGSSKGGRIPRIVDSSGSGGGRIRESGREEKRVLGEEGERRRERRERGRMKRREKSMGIAEKSLGGFGRSERNQGFESDHNQELKKEIYNPFPGREVLLKKVLNRKRFL